MVFPKEKLFTKLKKFRYPFNMINKLVTRIIGIIPVRYASTRFPGKPLIDIQGKSMIQRVYEQVKKSKKLLDIFVATDDKRIQAHVENFGGNVIMTSAKHKSGTDRCAEAAKKIKNK